MATDISSRVAWRLKRAIQGKDKKRQSGTGTATFVRRDSDGTAWVRLAGNDFDTPVKGISVDAEPGDAVSYEIRNGGVMVGGNTSSPSVSERAVDDAVAPVADLAQSAQDVASAISQFFWHDTNGAHVSSEAGNPAGRQNALWNASGMLFRKYANNLLALVTGSSPGVVIYDGAGNADGNIIASFVGSLIELGRNSTSAVINMCSGLGTVESGTSASGVAPGIKIGTKHVYVPLDETAEAYFIACGAADYPYDPMGRDWTQTGNPIVGMVADGQYASQSPVQFMLYASNRCAHLDADLIKLPYRTWEVDDIEDILTVLIDGYGQGASADENRMARALGLAKTASDAITITNLTCNGFLTTGRTQARISIVTPYRFYGQTSVALSGTYYARQNNSYLFGSTANAAASIANRYTATAYDDGHIDVIISTGSEQTSAVNNETISFFFPSITITLS